MTIKQAVEIVTKAAEANANGNFEANKILEAVALVRTYIREQED